MITSYSFKCLQLPIACTYEKSQIVSVKFYKLFILKQSKLYSSKYILPPFFKEILLKQQC